MILLIDPLTFEWTDGLIASATRKFAKDSGAMDDANRPSSETSKVLVDQFQKEGGGVTWYVGLGNLFQKSGKLEFQAPVALPKLIHCMARGF